MRTPEQTEALQNAKPGDHVVMRRRGIESPYLRRITRVTPAMIFIGTGTFSRYHRGTNQRPLGQPVGGIGEWIERVATAEEVQASTDRTRQEALAQAQRENSRAAIYAKRAELAALFPWSDVTVSHNGEDSFTLVLGDLTEALVRDLAADITARSK